MISALVVVSVALAGCTTSEETVPEEDFLTEGCERTTDPDLSVARIWNEQLLEAIRHDFPAPTVHARNLFHLSAAMWDAWAAYDDQAAGYYVDTTARATDVEAAREAAISHAAHRILVRRYERSFGAEETREAIDATMVGLCYDPENKDLEGDTPAALGNRIAAAVLELTREDGSHEIAGYVDREYESVNDPMVLQEPGTELFDPNRWQPLAFDQAQSQNGIDLPTNVQEFVGSHWGDVEAFALPAPEDGVPIDVGPPPYLGGERSDQDFKDAAVEVIAHSATLDPTLEETIDISPASMGNNPLGTYDGEGYETNPVTGEPYEPYEVKRGDFGRVVAEFWADGPDSETPPGHWNTLANTISDSLPELRIGGEGEPLDRLAWDVRLYFALNGATHDSAVAAWGLKAHYDYVRPISMIRYMGGLGQSSDPDGPSYHVRGLPLEEGLVEVVTEASSAPGERHEHLAEHVGEIAVRSWQAYPRDREADLGGVGWIRAVEWVPYQRSTFVTPAFAGYVSGHSTFSRAAAEVMTAMTGSPWFPEGLGTWTIEAEGLEFEAGPEEPIVLQWASYYDAADQAGISRLYGGIHVRADDLRGRELGATCGIEAWALATQYFDGSITA